MDGGKVEVRWAVAADVDSVMCVADAAYAKYVARLGRPPAPMHEDYGEALERGGLHVLTVDGRVVGLLELEVAPDYVYIVNAAIAPQHQKQGLGVHLLIHAESEARAAGVGELRLHTNVRMTENIALYEAGGFTVYDQREQDGYERVFMRKSIWNEERYFAALDDTRYRAAMCALFEQVQACGLSLQWFFSGAEITLPCDERTLVIGWAIPPGVVGWLYVTDLTLGCETTALKTPSPLSASLDRYVDLVKKIAGGRRPARDDLDGATFAPDSVVRATVELADAIAWLAT